ncbi:MAG: hypothetical protein K940chlam8_00061 [Chlamydiae bacterium]|nr:hypothetical protein [Chlamydiota bacterium]
MSTSANSPANLPPSSPPSSPTSARRTSPPVVPSTPLGKGGTSHGVPLGTPAPKDTSSSVKDSGPGILAPVNERLGKVLGAVTPGKERIESVKESLQSGSDTVGGFLGFDPQTTRQKRKEEAEALATASTESLDSSAPAPAPTTQRSKWSPLYWLGW